MKQAQPFIGQKLYRNTYSLDVLAEDLGIGQYIDFYLLDSPRTVFPEAFATALGTTVYGREMKFVEVNIDSTFTVVKHRPIAKQSMYKIIINVYFNTANILAYIASHSLASPWWVSGSDEDGHEMYCSWSGGHGFEARSDWAWGG